MSLRIHPTLRALGIGVCGLALLVAGSLAAVRGLSSLAQAGMAEPAAPAAAAAPERNYAAEAAEAKKRIPLIIKQSHGDWNRVSPEDQKLLNAATEGHGRGMLEAQAKAPKKRPIKN